MKGIAVNQLVMIIALTVVLLVILSIVFPRTAETLQKYSTAGQCEFSVLMSGVAKQISLGTRTAPIECKTHTLDVTPDYLKRYDKAATDAIARYQREGNLQAMAEYPNTDFGKNKWLVSKVVAQELWDCDNKGWKGAIPMTGFSDLFGKTGAGVCILCSRIKFDPAVQHLFTPGTFPLKPWLQHNYFGSTSYLDSITDGKVPFDKELIENLRFSIDEPLAVAYVALETKEEGSFQSLAIGKPIVAPYSKLTTDLGWDMTSGLGPLATTKPAYCGLIIGEIE